MALCVRPESGLSRFILLPCRGSHSANVEGQAKFSPIHDLGNAKVNSSGLPSYAYRQTECSDPTKVFAQAGAIRAEPLNISGGDIVQVFRRAQPDRRFTE